MALLGSALPAANTVAVLYTVPTARSATVNINLCNTGSTPAKVRVAVGNGTTPDNSGWIEYDAELPPAGVLERTALSLKAGEKVFVRASTAAVACNAWGVEELA